MIQAFKKALADALEIVNDIATEVDVNDDEEMYRIINSSIGTKFVSRWSKLMCGLALKAVRTVSTEMGGKKEVDIKRYARIEKIPGGEIEDSEVLDGVMVNKDITHPKMRRRIENPKVLLLDCTLEYKKGESQTNIEVSKEEDWNRILQIEEEQVKAMCDAIIALKPDLVITEKGVSGKLQQSRIVKASLTLGRSCPALPCQGQHYRDSPCPQDRQQPYRTRDRCYHRQLCLRRNSVRHRYTVWSVRNLQARRRVLHLPHKVQGPQGLYNPTPRTLEGYP